MLKRLSPPLLLSLLFSVLSASALASEPAVVVADPWVREPVPGRNISAGYMTLDNAAEQEQVLVAVHSPDAERVEIHSHTHVDGMMRMRKEEQVAIPAGSSLSLEPGGLHLMLFELREGLKAGDEMALELEFADGSRLPLSAPVRGIERP